MNQKICDKYSVWRSGEKITFLTFQKEQCIKHAILSSIRDLNFSQRLSLKHQQNTQILPPQKSIRNLYARPHATLASSKTFFLLNCHINQPYKFITLILLRSLFFFVCIKILLMIQYLNKTNSEFMPSPSPHSLGGKKKYFKKWILSLKELSLEKKGLHFKLKKNSPHHLRDGSKEFHTHFIFKSLIHIYTDRYMGLFF